MGISALELLAAGSLRSAFLPLVAHFQQHTGLAVDAQFGPAGLLRGRMICRKTDWIYTLLPQRWPP
ncbi:hypothetical protein FK513_28420, partial [Klebsiella pneumoniae]|nr:hypothetical protein [Klebsiella pneumoniae]